MQLQDKQDLQEAIGHVKSGRNRMSDALSLLKAIQDRNHITEAEMRQAGESDGR